ncbi:unnamed protein product, partial [Urochloa humidicola]
SLHRLLHNNLILFVEPVPTDPEDAQRRSLRDTSDRRFEVPLRPELWSSHAGSGFPVSPPQLHPTPPVSRMSNASGDNTGDFMDVPGQGRKKPVR